MRQHECDRSQAPSLQPDAGTNMCAFACRGLVIVCPQIEFAASTRVELSAAPRLVAARGSQGLLFVLYGGAGLRLPRPEPERTSSRRPP